MKNFAYIPQGRGGYISEFTIKLSFDALFTDEFSTCNIVIFIGGNTKKTLFLFHVDFSSNLREMKTSFESLEEPRQIFILSRSQGQHLRKGISDFLGKHITIKPVIIDVADNINGISASIQHNENNSIHPFIKLWSGNERPQVILHHPQEQQFLTVHKMEECIGIKHRALTGTIRNKQFIIFNEFFWKHIGDWEFTPEVTNASIKEELGLFSVDDPYDVIVQKLSQYMLSISNIVPIGGNLENISLSVAVYIETFLHNNAYEIIFKKNMQDLLENKGKHIDYTPNTKEDKKLKEDIIRILNTNSSCYLLINKIMDNYIIEAQSSEFKTCVLTRYFCFCMHYDDRKKYADCQLERVLQLAKAEKISDAAKKAYVETKYDTARNLFLEEMRYLTKYQINSHPHFAIAIHNLGRTEFRLGRYHEAKYLLNICLQLRKCFAVSDKQKIQLTEKAINECESELKKQSDLQVKPKLNSTTSLSNKAY